jgi:NADH:ubiquinone oxidoreductase subunit 5 (subunit L)/multisubunit Na+/H+ antiporter MnhA subunit
VLGGERFTASMPWLRWATSPLSLGFKFDDLAALMLAIVSFVGLAVHVFSSATCTTTRRARYFGGLSIFMFSMLGIVLADNLFMMFIFWELVGFSSYLLINHYHEKQSAADASKKAFIVNRVGDFGFLLGIISGVLEPRHGQPQSNSRRSRPNGGKVSATRSRCCSSAAPSASRPRCRSMSGCRTRWKARRPSPP